MKALTLHQPWASLVAIGAKTIETRSWSTSYRGPLAIHAAARPPRPGPIGDYFVRGFGTTGWALTGPGLPGFRSTPKLEGYIIPRGAVVAIAALVDVIRIECSCSGCMRKFLAEKPRNVIVWAHANPPEGEWDTPEITSERAYGDFTEGRFAWILRNVEALDKPVKARGHHRLWEWDAPEEGDQ